MPTTRNQAGQLELAGVLLASLATDFGTPAYVYDLGGIASSARALEAAFEGSPHLVCYAVKANSAGAVLRALAAEGCGADVVSGGELSLALACGVAPRSIVYSGVAKRLDELDLAVRCGDAGIGAVQIESVEELGRLEARAREAGRRARASVRVNPGLDQADATHAHIATGHDEAKFGVPIADLGAIVRTARRSPHLELVGMTVHAGSQLVTLEPYVAAARVLFDLTRDLRAAGALPSLAFVDAGGGFGVDYGDGASPEGLPSPADFVRAARAEQRMRGLEGCALYVEPGRSLVAAHGALLASVIEVKHTPTARWLFIDAGMNDLVRPALYQARHRVVSLEGPDDPTARVSWRIAGPVCESSDDFGLHLLSAEPPSAVALLDAGAYGYTMASAYNGRPLPAEVFLRAGRVVGATRRGSAEAWVGDRSGAGAEVVTSRGIPVKS